MNASPATFDTPLVAGNDEIVRCIHQALNSLIGVLQEVSDEFRRSIPQSKASPRRSALKVFAGQFFLIVMKRRNLLAAIGAGTVAATAGCMGLSGDEEEEEYATVQELLVQKHPKHHDPSTVDLRIERGNDNEAVHEGSYELVEYSEVVEIDCTWPDEPLRLMTRHAGDEQWNSHSTADWTDCVSVFVVVSESDTSFFVGTQECPHDGARCHTDVGSD